MVIRGELSFLWPLCVIIDCPVKGGGLGTEPGKQQVISISGPFFFWREDSLCSGKGRECGACRRYFSPD